jgi:hypothetical protein
MPIRFWYLPFALFSGECDLVPSEQVDEDIDEVGPGFQHAPDVRPAGARRPAVADSTVPARCSLMRFS